jgi:hypothetical protein
LRNRWVPPQLRDEIVDFVNTFSRRTERPVRWVLRHLSLAPGQYHRWTMRYGKANAHNGLIPREHWITEAERQAILNHHAKRGVSTARLDDGRRRCGGRE